LRRDPRVYQIGVLSGLLAYGMTVLDFEIEPLAAAVTLIGVLAVQYACTRLWKLDRFAPRSALISGLSLCLLLRTNSLGLVVVAEVVTIASCAGGRAGPHNGHSVNLARRNPVDRSPQSRGFESDNAYLRK